MKNIRKKFIAFLFALGCLVFCVSFSSKAYASWTPASEWKENGYPTEDWTTDHFTYHQIGFINDPKNNQLLLYVNMNRDEMGNYTSLQPSGYQIKINNHIYDLTLHDTWKIKKGQPTSAGLDVWDRTRNHPENRDTGCRYYSNSNGVQSAIVSIPYSVFNKEDLNASTNITMQNTNLGGQKEITISGASTGPYVPAIIAFILASIAVVGYYHKGKSTRHEHQ